MQNEWTREIERLTDLLKKSEEEIKKLQAERDGYRNGQQQMQDMNAKLIDANNALKEDLVKYKAFWDYSRLADKEQWEKYEWKEAANES